MYGWLNHITFTRPDASSNHPSVTFRRLFQSFRAFRSVNVPIRLTFTPGTSPAALPEAPAVSYRAGKCRRRAPIFVKPSRLSAADCRGVRRKCFEISSFGNIRGLYGTLIFLPHFSERRKPFRGVSQADGPRGSALPAGRDSDRSKYSPSGEVIHRCTPVRSCAQYW